jgi:hypothetical protein
MAFLSCLISLGFFDGIFEGATEVVDIWPCMKIKTPSQLKTKGYL